MPNILITNDDGITAPGIAALVAVAKNFGDVTVVAPDSPQSGQGHAITLVRPIKIKKTEIFEGVDAYECDGTPADCVKIAKYNLFKEKNIDFCFSGINHGSNAGINIIYSGTMSAAMEASIEGIQSVGFSLDNFSHEADFSAAQKVAGKIIHDIVNGSKKQCKLLNVNIPNLPFEKIKGIKICQQGKGTWKEKYMEGQDPRGGKYYWLTGEFQNEDLPETNSDINALQDGYVSVVPSHHDLTHYAALAEYDYLTHMQG